MGHLRFEPALFLLFIFFLQSESRPGFLFPLENTPSGTSPHIASPPPNRPAEVRARAEGGFVVVRTTHGRARHAGVWQPRRAPPPPLPLPQPPPPFPRLPSPPPSPAPLPRPWPVWTPLAGIRLPLTAGPSCHPSYRALPPSPTGPHPRATPSTRDIGGDPRRPVGRGVAARKPER